MEATSLDPTIVIPALILGPYWIPYVPFVAVFGFYFVVPYL